MFPGDPLLRAVLLTAAFTAVLSVGLVMLKVINRMRRRWHGVRIAQYVAAVAEILTRGKVPDRVPVGWSEDPAFGEVLVDYASNLAGDELETLEQLIERLDLRARLVKRMRRGRLGSRLAAAAVLSEIPGSEGERALVNHLSDRSPLVRLQAARGLARLGHLPIVPMLLADIHRQSDWMAVRIADLLTGMGSTAVPLLIEHLTEDTHPLALTRILRILRSIGDLQAELELLRLVAHTDPEVRTAAASALGTCGTPTAVPYLLVAAGDGEWQVRARIARALGRVGGTEVVETLASMLRDPAWWVRQNAAEALAEVSGGLARLVAATSDPDPYAKDAALQQLGISGAIRTARGRAEVGSPSQLDWVLLERVALEESMA